MAASGAIADLYASESRALAHSLTRKLGSLQQAEDVLHDAYVRMLTIAAHAREPLRSPKAYLFTVASNLALDCMRREQLQRRLFVPLTGGTDESDSPPSARNAPFHDVPSPEPSVEDHVSSMMEVSSIEKVLTALPPRCRHAFFLHLVMDLPQREVAKRLGVSVSMVEKHISKAAKQVRVLNDP